MTATEILANAGLILGLQVVPVIVGYRAKVAGIARESWGRPLARFIIIVIETAISLVAAWRLDIDWSVMGRLLPIAALFGLCMTAVGWALSRILFAGAAERGGVLLATAISNFGFTMAGFVCLLIGGNEEGRNAVSIHSIYIAPLGVLIFLLWFPLARAYGIAAARAVAQTAHPAAPTPPPPSRWELVGHSLRGLIEPTSLPMYSMVVGVALHEFGVAWPSACDPILDGLVYADVVLSMFCVGITLQLGSLFQFRAATIALMAAKYLIAPVIGIGLAWNFGIRGTPLLVVAVCSSVPAGLFSTFAASIYGLNRNLTNAILILTTGFYLVVVLPLLFWLLPYLTALP